MHPTGAIKLRGAFHAVLSLSAAARKRGVVAHSSGNHALAVAYAAHRLGVKAVVVMPRDAPLTKIEGTRRWGAEIVMVGSASHERSAMAAKLASEHGYAPIEPYDSLHVIAATATIALEVLDQHPRLRTIVAPLSGGGLMAGIAIAIKALQPAVRVIGAEPEVAADACQSLREGRIVTLPAEEMARTLADGLRVQSLGTLTWPFIQACVDDAVTVSERAIGIAVRRIAREARLVAEPSGAVATAAALTFAPESRHDTVAVLTGGNVDPLLYAALINGEA
jgi:threonine dehydratase